MLGHAYKSVLPPLRFADGFLALLFKKSRAREFIYVPLIILCLSTIAFTTPASSEAEATAKRFAEALAQFEVAPMVEEFHSDVQQYFKAMAIHILETTKDGKEKADLLKSFGVESVDQFKKFSPKTATIRFFNLAFSIAPKEAKEASIHSKIIVVGSIPEKDLIHVLYRTEAELPTLSMNVNVPSVVTLKLEDNKWKVINTTQLDSMKAKLAK